MTKLDVEAIGLDRIGETIRLMVNDIEQLGKYDLEDEIVLWQAEDMHRQYPNVVTENEKTVMTRIWPRSRTWVPPQKTGSHRVQQVIARARTSTRPILRPELFTRLCDRMFERMCLLLKWDV